MASFGCHMMVRLLLWCISFNPTVIFGCFSYAARSGSFDIAALVLLPINCWKAVVLLPDEKMARFLIFSLDRKILNSYIIWQQAKLGLLLKTSSPSSKNFFTATMKSSFVSSCRMLSTPPEAEDPLIFRRIQGRAWRNEREGESRQRGLSTLTISDQGIGMDAEDIEKYINQIAFSGAEEFLAKYKDTANSIIGHFGLGFYSAFMVSKKVEIRSLSYKEGQRPWNGSATAVRNMR